ncbi:DUF421 domain-containing protein [Brevibacillus laterosporus]|uniref:YetF domain-containing protein n=1 Tax=Brevibacillus laterosporus TaxID=1465 RepID=UPI000368FDDA|nr:DUF421 domain-containing protein [Brevibacillus laterosporus]ATO51282.1 hypothetical protein BrL25_20595 [Brevibacillus laterosporus DSM 25]MBG9804217.1 membrane protein [Brevibacillus laterosporus]MED2004058.1 DUF421 domain-containing protein [Brevibacillus laterosporus]MED4763275.1 DUF421 domain-containing protein [Brevibacillus laterosporus]TPH14748.1 DUF421 domain-containing protein [Brevibacillus laterosporus]
MVNNVVALLDIAGRTFFSFLTLLLLTRILGKKQLSHLTFFNYVTGITIGSMAASSAFDKHINFIEAIFSLIMWSLLTILVEYISLKSNKARVILDGQPTILIKKGKIMADALARVRMNMDDLSMLLREEHVFSIKDVAYAILEPNGRLSVMKTKGATSVTREDLKIKKAEVTIFPSELIVDGQIVEKNLKEFNLNKKWLLQELDKQGITSLKDVVFAELQEDGCNY